MDFNKNWLLEDDFGLKRIVDLPYDAMFHEERDASSPNGTECAFFNGKRYKFTKEFTIDALDKYYAVLFEAVYQKAIVYLNGHKILEHLSGTSEFKVELNEHLRLGRNVLEVIADNTLTPNCRWYTGGGIYRDVHFIEKEINDIQNVYIETTDYQTGQIQIRVESLTEPAVTIYDEDTLVYQGKPGLITIPHPWLWNAEHPHLYKAIIETKQDREELTFGIRSLFVSSETGLLVNGKKILLKGACVHSDNGLLGVCSYYDAEYNKVKALKDAGFNAIRCAHNPCSRHFLKACDELGMYVMDEVYDGWYTPKTYHDSSRRFTKENYTDDIKSMVRKDYNHPCVMMYSIGNEVSELAHEKGYQTCKDLYETVKLLDKTRPVTCGVNLLICVYDQLGMGVYKDKEIYKEEPLTPKKLKKQKKSGSTFFNFWIQKLGTIMFLMSKGRMADKIATKSFESLDVLGLNYGSSRYEQDALKYKNRIMVGTETMVSNLAYNWSMVEKHNSLLGDFVWAGVEYLGEAGFGDWTYFSYPGLPITSGSGVIDLTLKETAELKYMHVIYNKEPKPIIALRPVNHSGEVPYKSAWRMTDAIESYNFNGYEGQKAVVEVYAYAPYIKLLVNDKPIGFKKTKDYRALFHTKYVAGQVEAIAYDENKNELARSVLFSGDGQKHLRVHCSKDALRANSNDLSYIEIEFVDSDNQLLPCVEQEVRVNLSKNLELLSFGSALGTINESYFDNVHTSYRGRLLLIVKAVATDVTGTETTDEARVTISSRDVESQTVNLYIQK